MVGEGGRAVVWCRVAVAVVDEQVVVVDAILRAAGRGGRAGV